MTSFNFFLTPGLGHIRQAGIVQNRTGLSGKDRAQGRVKNAAQTVQHIVMAGNRNRLIFQPEKIVRQIIGRGIQAHFHQTCRKENTALLKHGHKPPDTVRFGHLPAKLHNGEAVVLLLLRCAMCSMSACIP